MCHWFALLTIHTLGAQPPTVVLDPGHGGSDLGAQYRSSVGTFFEKDITLALAVETQRELARLGVRALLTRRSDATVELGPRTQLANRQAALAFVSIHLNSTPEKTASAAGGIETFALTSSEDTASRLAKLGGSVLAESQAAKIAHQADEASSDLGVVLKDMWLDSRLKQSQRLAALVQRELTQSLVGRDRGVKDAHFHVLLGADMPSILVEAGFLNNPQDRAVLLRREGRRKVARALARAIHRFVGR